MKASRPRRCTAPCSTSPPTPEHHLERALAQAERLQLYDHTAIDDAIARANGHRGTKRLAQAIAADPQWTRSELERRMRKLARNHGLPRPISNHTLDAPDHPGLRPTSTSRHHLVVETDGWDTHQTGKPSRTTAPRTPP